MAPQLIVPQASAAAGSKEATFSAGLSNEEGSIRLLTNGALSVICRPALQAGEVIAVKSPATVAAVGTKAMLFAGSWRRVVPWYPPKKNNLFFMIGPPKVPPNWLRLSVLFVVAK